MAVRQLLATGQRLRWNVSASAALDGGRTRGEERKSNRFSVYIVVTMTPGPPDSPAPSIPNRNPVQQMRNPKPHEISADLRQLARDAMVTAEVQRSMPCCDVCVRRNRTATSCAA